MPIRMTDDPQDQNQSDYNGDKSGGDTGLFSRWRKNTDYLQSLRKC